MEFKYSQISEKGNYRHDNQDRVSVKINQYNNLLGIVCDGIGGHPDGDIAAQTLVDTLTKSFLENNFNNFSNDLIEKWFNDEIKQAISTMKNIAKTEDKSVLMGTTLTGVLITNNDVIVVNVGDSRVYKVDDSNVELITIDQNVKNSNNQKVLDKVDALIKRQNEKSSDQKANDLFAKRMGNVLISAVGPKSQMVIDFYELDNVTQKFFIASDGLYNFVDNKEIELAFKAEDWNESLKILLKLAENNRSTDNLSGILLEVIYG